ncbi:manganese efflux pump MntP family protein [Intestinibacillus massiliensis]|nr:manganese efflux pump MntP family protein [Intestinibacillus massiliensis]
MTAIMVMISIYVGRKFGDLLGSKAEILGGTILVIIGIKAIL